MVVPLLLLLLAGGLRFARIDEPSRIAFDEGHYVPDARDYLDQGVEAERPAHPPAAKWLIAASISVLGDRPMGWRFASAAAGTVAVGATYLMGRQLFRPWWAGALAALLVAIDGLALTMSRIAMLDGIQAGFVAIGALFTLWDRHSSHRRWRWAGGVALGIGVAVKWSSAFALLAAVALVLGAELVDRRQSTGTSAPAAARGAVRSVMLPFIVLPVVIYVASYAGWFANVEQSESGRDRCAPDCSITEVVSAWVFEQWDMWDLQRRLEADHPDRSRPTAWLTLGSPVLTYAEGCSPDPDPDDDCRVAPGTRARVLALGNPALWWTALAAYPYMAWLAIARRNRPAIFVSAFLAAQILPWFASWKPGFAFYMTPVVPFVALAVVLALTRLSARWRWAQLLPVAVALAAAGCAVWLYPIWTGMELSPSALDARLWLASWR